MIKLTMFYEHLRVKCIVPVNKIMKVKTREFETVLVYKSFAWYFIRIINIETLQNLMLSHYIKQSHKDMCTIRYILLQLIFEQKFISLNFHDIELKNHINIFNAISNCNFFQTIFSFHSTVIN